MSGWHRRLERADEASRHDRAFVLSCVAREGLALEAAPAEFRSDPGVVALAVEQDGLALRFASQELRRDRGLVLAAVRSAGLALACASLELRRDREVVLAAVREDGLALEHAGRELRGDRGIVLAAVEQSAGALEYARTALRGDRDVVLAAVARSGGALEFAAGELRGDEEVCRVACHNDPQAVQFIADPEVERKVRASVLQDACKQLRRAREQEARRAEGQRKAREEAAQKMLSWQVPRKKEPRRDRRQERAKAEHHQAVDPLVAAWAEQAFSGGRVYRMIAGWREENLEKISKTGALDWGDPWEREQEKQRPEPKLVQLPPQAAPVAGPAQPGQPPRTVVSIVRQEIYTGPEPGIVRSHIQSLVHSMTGSTDIDMDTPLMESGLDSLASVDLRTQLQTDFKVQLSSTVMFNYPTVAMLTDYLVEQLTVNKVPGWGRVVIQEVAQEVLAPQEAQAAQPQQVVAPQAPAYQGPDELMVRGHIISLVQTMTGSSDIDMDTPLMESGLDSIASVDLRTQMQKDFTLDLPSTVMFNYPTMSGLTAYLVERLDSKRIAWGRA